MNDPRAKWVERVIELREYMLALDPAECAPPQDEQSAEMPEVKPANW